MEWWHLPFFYIATITGLCPNEENFDPNEREEDTIDFDTNRAGFGKYIEDYHVTNNPEFYDKEHIAFLSLWLLRCIFYYKSLKVAKHYLNLSNQLHEGCDIILSQLILGSLYESLRVVTDALKTLQPKDNLLLSGPFWLLQLWINATFKLSLDVNKLNNASDIIKNRRVKWPWLIRTDQIEKHFDLLFDVSQALSL